MEGKKLGSTGTIFGEVRFMMTIGLVVAAFLAGLFSGFVWGARMGRACGRAEGKAEAPLQLRERALLQGECPVCGGGAYLPAGDKY